MNDLITRFHGNSRLRAFTIENDWKYNDCWLFWDRFPEELLGTDYSFSYENFEIRPGFEESGSATTFDICPDGDPNHHVYPFYLGEEDNVRRNVPEAIERFACTISEDCKSINIPQKGYNFCDEFCCSAFHIILWARYTTIGFIVKDYQPGLDIEYQTEDGEILKIKDGEAVFTSDVIHLSDRGFPLKTITMPNNVSKVERIYDRWYQAFSSIC